MLVIWILKFNGTRIKGFENEQVFILDGIYFSIHTPPWFIVPVVRIERLFSEFDVFHHLQWTSVSQHHSRERGYLTPVQSLMYSHFSTSLTCGLRWQELYTYKRYWVFSHVNVAIWHVAIWHQSKSWSTHISAPAEMRVLQSTRISSRL